MCVVDGIQGIFQVAFREEMGHAEILIQVVSAVVGGGTWDFAFVIADEFVHFCDDRNNITRRKVTGEDGVKTGAAAIGPK